MADDESEYEYEVNKIIDKKIEKGQVFYKINWKGYDDKFDTWEPVENLSHSTIAIEIYERKVSSPTNTAPIRKRRRSCGDALVPNLTSTPRKGRRNKRKRVRFSSSCEYVLLSDGDSDISWEDTSLNVSAVTYDLKLPTIEDEPKTKVKVEADRSVSRPNKGQGRGRPRKCSSLPSTSARLAQIDSVIDDVIKREAYVCVIQAEVENVKASLRTIQDEKCGRQNDDHTDDRKDDHSDRSRSCSPELYPTSSFSKSAESLAVSTLHPGPISPSMPRLEKCVFSPRPCAVKVNDNLAGKRICNDNCFRRPISSQVLRVAPIRLPENDSPPASATNLPPCQSDSSPYVRALARLKENVTKLEQMMTNLKLGQVSKGGTLKRLMDIHKRKNEHSPLSAAMRCLVEEGDPESHVNGLTGPIKTLQNGGCRISLDSSIKMDFIKSDASGSANEEKADSFRSDLKRFKLMWNKRYELLTHPKKFPISYLLSDQEKIMMDQKIKAIITKNDVQELNDLLHNYHSCHLNLNLIHNDKTLLTMCCTLPCSSKFDHSLCSVMECLLIKGADVNQIIGQNGSTALFLAASKGFVCQTQLLIRYGANLATLNEHGENVLFPVRETNFISL